MLNDFHEDVKAGVFPTRALTLRNPWPWLMFHVPREHRKTVENRSRNLGFHREFWIHTSKESARDDWTAAAATAANAGVPVEFHPNADGVLEKLPCGHIVARVVCSAHVAPGGIVRWPAKDAGKVAYASPWYFGTWGYVIESFTLVTPIPCAGALGFWRIPLDVLEKLGKAALNDKR